jgi:hypothetical protein
MAYLNYIRIGEKHFTHDIDLNNDSTYLKDEDGIILFEVSYDGVMTDGSEKRYGTFHMDRENKWFFAPGASGYHSKFTMTIKSNDLIETEKHVFTFMLNVREAA